MDLVEQSLRDKQVAAIKQMLHLNEDPVVAETKDKIWKVLVFDKLGRDVISSVLRVNDLFKCGITVHMLIESERYPLPEVPAIYFCAPTEENIRIIAKDLKDGLYESWHLNFTSPLPRNLLEELAQETLQTAQQIAQVYDQYMNFIVTEPNIYSLGLKDVYSKLNTPKIEEKEIEEIVDNIVNGLFSVVLTSGSIPIIRSSRGDAAEMVAAKLEKKLKNHAHNSRNQSSSQQQHQGNRPVLILLDRNIDLVSMFSHSWTYQSLINDACELNRNRITVNVDGQNKAYDLDPSDFFWSKNAMLPFPEVADNLDAALNKYKQDAKELTSQTGITDFDDPTQLSSNNTLNLKAAITQLPELTARKHTIDMHMNIATTLLKAVGDRGLAQFFEAEENASKQTKATILELINNPEFKNPEDKMRMFLIYYLLTDKITTSDLGEFENALKEQGCDLAALDHVKRNKEVNKMKMIQARSSYQASATNQQSSDLFKSFSGITNKLTDRLKDGKLSEGFGSLISGVKNFLPASKDLPITKIVESILEPQSAAASATDDFLYFDPKVTRGAASRPPKRQNYDEAIIFTVGGGNYFEYSNLQDWVQRVGAGKRVIYGSTELCNPSHFLNECVELGNSMR